MSLLSDIGTAIKNKLGGTSVDNTVPRYDGTTCKLQGSGVTISDTNAVTASGGFVGNLTGNAETVTNGVYTTTNQTIEGVKTFSSSPIVPTPTTGTQAVNKNYADLKVDLAAFTGANKSLSGSGYQKLPGGLIIQWGSYTYAATQANLSTVTFPIAFPTACLSASSNATYSANSLVSSIIIGKTSTTVTIGNYGYPGHNAAGGIWIAIGY